jgi:diguanylate cyclase (GGDEF)-like protein
MPGNADILDARILIVDDKEVNVRLLDDLLRGEGYRNLANTRDPYAVCDMHRAQPFDLILLDLQMPGMDGFQVMEGLGKIERGGYAPVLAITVEPDHKLRALAAGAKDFISKPFDLVELKTRIHNMLEVRLLYKKLEHAVNTLESLALHDALTGLPNRRLLMDRLHQARLSSARQHKHCALMFMDLDRFKLLNDSLGHDVGDVLLQQVGARLLPCVREGDCVARFGGDEFVVLLDSLSGQPLDAVKQAETIALKISHALSQPYNLTGYIYESTQSMGIVVFSSDDEPIGNLLKKADMAMYRAKSMGRNAVCFFDPGMQAAVHEREILDQEMRRGLATQEFMLYYQIQVNASGTPVGAEALVRWMHGRHGLLVPSSFIVQAEETGMILPLGQWVLETACLQLLVWAQSPETASWTLAVNMSASQVAQVDFAESVIRVLEKTGAPAQRLILELTEGSLVNNLEDTLTKMKHIHSSGVGFCLDDFGAGFPSLAYLHRLPLAQLKVDQALVHVALKDESVAIIARTMVELGASLGLPVVVEGVETQAQRDFFANLGRAVFQGNFFGSPALPDTMMTAYQSNQSQAEVKRA